MSGELDGVELLLEGRLVGRLVVMLLLLLLLCGSLRLRVEERRCKDEESCGLLPLSVTIIDVSICRAVVGEVVWAPNRGAGSWTGEKSGFSPSSVLSGLGLLPLFRCIRMFLVGTSRTKGPALLYAVWEANMKKLVIRQRVRQRCGIVVFVGSCLGGVELSLGCSCGCKRLTWRQ